MDRQNSVLKYLSRALVQILMFIATFDFSVLKGRDIVISCLLIICPDCNHDGCGFHSHSIPLLIT